MKRELVDLLRHPCSIIFDTISKRHCQFDIEYDGRNRFCRDCSLGAECQWLCTHDTLRAAYRLPTKDLIEALHWGRDSVAARVARAHNLQACACADCRWLRRTRRFLLDIGSQPRTWSTD